MLFQGLKHACTGIDHILSSTSWKLWDSSSLKQADVRGQEVFISLPQTHLPCFRASQSTFPFSSRFFPSISLVILSSVFPIRQPVHHLLLSCCLCSSPSSDSVFFPERYPGRLIGPIPRVTTFLGHFGRPIQLPCSLSFILV